MEPDIFEAPEEPVEADFEEVPEKEASKEEEPRVIHPETAEEPETKKFVEVPDYEFDDEPEEPEPEPRYVPEGMVLPTDDDDETPRMKMPEMKAPVGPDGKTQKLKLNRPGASTSDGSETEPAAESKKTSVGDFDIAFVEGDDFDI